MKLKIGNILMNGGLVLGPMAGVTDLPFRLLCKEQGADLIYTEMVSGKGIIYNNKNTESMLVVEEEERPVALQLFGRDPYILGEAVRKIDHKNFDILDINMGCPVPKVVNNGEGSALMKEPRLVGEIVKSVVNATKKPITVKIRKGFNDDMVNGVEIAKIIEDNGASAIAVHGRTREQYYSGKADWSIIGDVKANVSIPVIGNGDIFSAADAIRMVKETRCDGVMIARAAKGNPWIFREMKSYLENNVIISKPTLEETVDMILRHARLSILYKGESVSMREMRKHITWYISGFPQSSRFKVRVNEINSYDELEIVLGEYLDFAVNKSII